MPLLIRDCCTVKLFIESALRLLLLLIPFCTGEEKQDDVYNPPPPAPVPPPLLLPSFEFKLKVEVECNIAISACETDAKQLALANVALIMGRISNNLDNLDASSSPLTSGLMAISIVISAELVSAV